MKECDSQSIQDVAQGLGFALIGVAPATHLDLSHQLRRCAAGRNGAATSRELVENRGAAPDDRVPNALDVSFAAFRGNDRNKEIERRSPPVGDSHRLPLGQPGRE